MEVLRKEQEFELNVGDYSEMQRVAEVDLTSWEYFKRVTSWLCRMNGGCGAGSRDCRQPHSLEHRVGWG